MNQMRSVLRFTTTMAALCAATAGLLGCNGSPDAAPGSILPPDVRPDGISLSDMARESALFTTSGNDKTYYPDTPFQILYMDWSKAQSQTVQMDGQKHLVVSGANDFAAVPEGKTLYVPV